MTTQVTTAAPPAPLDDDLAALADVRRKVLAARHA